VIPSSSLLLANVFDGGVVGLNTFFLALEPVGPWALVGDSDVVGAFLVFNGAGVRAEGAHLAAVELTHGGFSVVGALGLTSLDDSAGVFLLGDLELDVQVDESLPLVGGPLVLDFLDVAGRLHEEGTHDTFPLWLVSGTVRFLVVEGRGSPHVLDLLSGGGEGGKGSGGNEVLHLVWFFVCFIITFSVLTMNLRLKFQS